MSQPRLAAAPASEGAAHCRAGFDALYLTHFDAAVRWATLLGCPRDQAEDVAQEAFLVAFRRFGDYDPSRSFRPWILGIVRRVARDRRRAGARRSRRESGAPAPQAIDDLERGAELGRVRRFVEDFLAGLPKGQREAFALCEIEGLQVPEAAEVLGQKVSTVRARKRHAREKFERAVSRWRARQERET